MSHDQRSESKDGDLTPEVGAATDVAPLGRQEPKPAHELTAAEDSDPVNWSRVTQLPEFRTMVRAKLRFIIPATLFFVVYYFALPVLVGYAPGLMSKKVLGVVNVAYLFALSQFFMAWIIAALYIRAAAKFDVMEHCVIEKAEKAGGPLGGSR
ncbi:MAG TPA: DUF485 domain-containing protein [Pyrinomonadaceae bacterium]|nr:DUF485 domain-containing protein [Pyrinomonadaceae bacterium]